MGVYKDKVEAGHVAQKLSLEEIRRNKCERCKVRNQNRRTEKQRRAEELRAERGKLSPKQQLQRLDWRLGKGVGAKKERARLAEMIEQ